ncbi:MAG: hypothetical protein M0P13_09195 [Fibrobacteraceae bacterium]|nr:hypothetical protein [Fibrobacteraceae bacterium]
MHLLSESNNWITESEFVTSTGAISKAAGETKIEIFEDHISNKSFAVIDGRTIKNDYIIKRATGNRFSFQSQNPELGIQTGSFDIDRNTIYSRFAIENTKLSGFEIITRNGGKCIANGALYNDKELINTWTAKMKLIK